MNCSSSICKYSAIFYSHDIPLRLCRKECTLGKNQIKRNIASYNFDKHCTYMLQPLCKVQTSDSKMKFYENTRPCLEPVKMGSISQGTVFSCVRAPRYNGSRAYGLVVTARCDVVQEKVHVLNFVPVVQFSDWLKQDCLSALVQPERNALQANLKNVLLDAGVAPSLLESVGINEIEKTFFARSSTMSKKERGMSDRFEKVRGELKKFEGALEQGASDTLDYFKVNRPKLLDRVLERLLTHDFSDCYLFERLIEDEPDIPYVALLRDVLSLDQAYIKYIAGGLSLEVLESELAPIRSQYVEIDRDDLCMPIAQVGSPTIEHLMQKFSSLFSRIGLADPDQGWKHQARERYFSSNEVGS